MVPSQLPFSVSQKIGLTEPYKAPVIVAEVPKPEFIAATVEPPVEVKNSVKAARKRNPTRVVRQSVSQQRYAAYPTREYGSSW